jgi:hypothetical protein
MLPGVAKRGHDGVAEALSWATRPATRPPESAVGRSAGGGGSYRRIAAAGAPSSSNDRAGAVLPRAALDSLDQFRGPGGGGGNAIERSLHNQQQRERSLALGGGAVPGAELASQMAQVMARLTNLEQENTSLKRAIEQRDAEMRKAASGEQVLHAVTRQMQEIDETLRRASHAHEGTSRRVRAIEDAVGLGATDGGGGAHSARIRSLEEGWRDSQLRFEALDGSLSRATGERTQLGEAAQQAVAELRTGLRERLEAVSKAAAAQDRAALDERRGLEEAMRSMVTQLAEDVGKRFAEVHAELVPGVDRSLREQLDDLRRGLEGAVAQMAEETAVARDSSERGDAAIRKDLRDLQSVAQKGLLQLRSESEKQGKALASIVKEEISTRTLNAETTNKRIEEVRIPPSSSWSSSFWFVAYPRCQHGRYHVLPALSPLDGWVVCGCVGAWGGAGAQREPHRAFGCRSLLREALT